ncbi:MAG: hypothetical protein HC825_03925 [Oscillatoriales cyanobacterium RM1_1_9]|nr:hypothetical protein [Oscillatoriales cyanobacterium RM1_1_9]
MKDTFVSGIAASFSYPLFFGFLYYLLQESRIQCFIFLILEGLFYPPITFLSAGILLIQLLTKKFQNFQPSGRLMDYKFYIAGLLITITFLIIYRTNASEYGPLISYAEAKNLPEFQPDGRASFF